MNTPRFAAPAHRDYLRDVAVHLLRERERQYPALIEKGVMAAADAAAKLELSRCLVAQWQWALDPARPPLPVLTGNAYFGAWPRQLHAELHGTAAAARTRASGDAATGFDRELAELIDALLWWQQPIGAAGCRLTEQVAFARSVTAEWRARNTTALAA